MFVLVIAPRYVQVMAVTDRWEREKEGGRWGTVSKVLRLLETVPEIVNARRGRSVRFVRLFVYACVVGGGVRGVSASRKKKQLSKYRS